MKKKNTKKDKKIVGWFASFNLSITPFLAYPMRRL